jgi:hypothetical protein
LRITEQLAFLIAGNNKAIAWIKISKIIFAGNIEFECTAVNETCIDTNKCNSLIIIFIKSIYFEAKKFYVTQNFLFSFSPLHLTNRSSSECREFSVLDTNFIFF